MLKWRRVTAVTTPSNRVQNKTQSAFAILYEVVSSVFRHIDNWLEKRSALFVIHIFRIGKWLVPGTNNYL